MVKALRRELLIVGVVFLIGVLVGWFVLGWWLAPVEWTDAAPVDLQPSYRDAHIAGVAAANATGLTTPNEVGLLGKGERWSYADFIAEVNRLAAGASPEARAAYEKLALDLAPLAAQEQATPPPAAAQPSPLVWLLLILALAAVAFFTIMLVRRGGQAAPAGAAGVGAPAARGAVAVWPDEAQPPLRQYDLTYVIGDDRFDLSNAIETSSGMFLGECGMGISETIGTPDPSKVTAFEVWLFDKNDIRTVTTVLMSEHAYNDTALHAKLAAKGDLVKAEVGTPIALETATLRVRARVTELEYGAGALPDKSFFNRLHVVMAAWPIGDSGITQPADAVYA
jgi:hypothetical protein